MWIVMVLKCAVGAVPCLESVCPAAQRGNGHCDLPCMSGQCGFDSFGSQCFPRRQDCAAGCRCSASLLGNGICESGKSHIECAQSECGWDMGDCGYCAQGCKCHTGPYTLLENGVCDQTCNTLGCNYDSGDCVTEESPFEVIVSPAVPSLSRAITEIPASFVRVKLLPGTHSLADSIDIRGSVVLMPVSCNYGETCADGDKPMIAVCAQVSVWGSLTLANIAIRSACVGSAPFLKLLEGSELFMLSTEVEIALSQQLIWGASARVVLNNTELLSAASGECIVLEGGSLEFTLGTVHLGSNSVLLVASSLSALTLAHIGIVLAAGSRIATISDFGTAVISDCAVTSSSDQWLLRVAGSTASALTTRNLSLEGYFKIAAESCEYIVMESLDFANAPSRIELRAISNATLARLSWTEGLPTVIVKETAVLVLSDSIFKNINNFPLSADIFTVSDTSLIEISNMTFANCSCTWSILSAKSIRMWYLSFSSSSGQSLLLLADTVIITDLVFEENENAGQEPCIVITGSAVSMSDSVIRGNRANNGLIQVSEASSLMLTNVTVQSNVVAGVCAGIRFLPSHTKNAVLSVVDSVFLHNQAFASGVLSVQSIADFSLNVTVELTIKNAVFRNNSAVHHGSALSVKGYVRLANSTVISSRFENNACGDGGAGLSLQYLQGWASVQDSVFVGNTGQRGAAVYSSCDDAKSGIQFVRSRFQSNSGSGVLTLDGHSALDTQWCEFQSNSGSAVRLSGAVWRDQNSSFLGNRASAGAAFSLSTASIATLSGSTLRLNTATGKGGVGFASFGSIVTAIGCLMELNSCGDIGGVIYIDNGSTFSATATKFVRNTGKNMASVLYAHRSTVTLTDVELSLNAVAKYSCVSVTESTLTLRRVQMSNNTAGSRTPGLAGMLSTIAIADSAFSSQVGKAGAFLFITDFSAVAISQSQFWDCRADSGGGFYITLQTTFTMTNSLIRNCSAPTDGGAVTSRICTLLFDSVQVQDITSALGTAALFILQSTLTVKNCTFTRLQGGAVLMTSGGLTVASSQFSTITAIYGAAVNCAECTAVSVSLSRFEDNRARVGGAVYQFSTGALATPPASTFTGNVFRRNHAAVGGALFSESIQVALVNNSFHGNAAESFPDMLTSGVGGAVRLACAYTAFCAFTVTSNEFLNNSAATSGGALQWTDSYPQVVNNTMAQNRADYGADVASFAVRLTLVNENGSLLSYMSTEESPLVAVFDNIPSGQVYPGSLNLVLVDQYDTVLSIDSRSNAQFEPPEGVHVFGGVQVVANNGLFTFQNFTISGQPESQATLLIVTNGVEPQQKSLTRDPSTYHKSVSVTLRFRACVPGESLQDGECRICPVNTYSLAPQQQCTSCPTHAVCLGGAEMLPKAGYWKPEPLSEKIFLCPHPSACLEPAGSHSRQCATGHTGNLCDVCESGYAKHISGECRKCGSLWTNVIWHAVLCILFLVALAALSTAAVRSPASAALAKVLIGYLQSAMLVAAAGIRWPDFAQGWLSAQRAAGNAQALVATQCLLRSLSAHMFLASEVALVLVPLCLILATLFITLSLSACMNQWISKWLSSTIATLFVLHTQLAQAFFSAFVCMEIKPGEYWLIADLAQRCWVWSHLRVALGVSLPGVLVWVVGLPLLCILWLWRNRRCLPVAADVLTNCYKPEHFLWDFVGMGRRILLALCLLFLRDVSLTVQSLSLLAVCISFLALHLYMRPFRTPRLNHLETQSISASLLVVYSALFVDANGTGDIHSGFFGKAALLFLVLLAHAFFLFSWLRQVAAVLQCRKRVYRVEQSKQEAQEGASTPSANHSVQPPENTSFHYEGTAEARSHYTSAAHIVL